MSLCENKTQASTSSLSAVLSWCSDLSVQVLKYASGVWQNVFLPVTISVSAPAESHALFPCHPDPCTAVTFRQAKCHPPPFSISHMMNTTVSHFTVPLCCYLQVQLLVLLLGTVVLEQLFSSCYEFGILPVCLSTGLKEPHFPVADLTVLSLTPTWVQIFGCDE